MSESNTLPRAVTLRQVATKAGVSAMTVSLALRGDAGEDRMSAETREKVLRAAKELGYRPNARARALRLGRTNVIGLYAGHGFINVRIPFFTEVVSGLQEGCEQTRKDLLLHGMFHGSSELDIFRELVDGRIDGLVVSLPRRSELAVHLANSEFAVVAIADPVPGIPSVTVDDADGSRQIVELLYQKGHRKVVYGTSLDQGIQSAVRRQTAFLDHAQRHGMTVSARPLIPDEIEGQFARATVDFGATALVCWNDLPAIYNCSAATRLGIRVPEDLAIVGFDRNPSSLGETPYLTTVEAPWAEVARVAVLQLNSILNGEPVSPETVLPVRLIEGRTT